VPRSNNQLNFSIEGPGRIVATDNGDPTSHEPFQSKTRKVFNGLCLVIVSADKGSSGAITLKVESKGLTGASVKINIGGK
jgi:beta-galactosidase